MFGNNKGLLIWTVEFDWTEYVPTFHSGYCGITDGMTIVEQKLITIIDWDVSELFYTLLVIKFAEYDVAVFGTCLF
jgi:hypothetical protein